MSDIHDGKFCNSDENLWWSTFRALVLEQKARELDPHEL